MKAPDHPVPSGDRTMGRLLVQALEAHSFEPIKMLQWRNTALDFSSLGALQATLAATPTEQGLTRAPIAEDILYHREETFASLKAILTVRDAWVAAQNSSSKRARRSIRAV